MSIFKLLGAASALIPGVGPVAASLLSGAGAALDAKKANKKAEKKANDAAKTARTTAKADALNKFTDLRKAGEAAGYHPLEVLRSNGGGGFGDYGSPIALTSDVQTGYTDNIADVMMRVQEDAQRQKEHQDRMAVLEKEASQIVRPASGGTAAVSSGAAQRAAFAAGLMNEDGIPIDVVGNERTPGLAFGVLGTLPTSDQASDAEFAEQRYGDIAQEAVGLMTLGTDLGNAAYDKFGAVRSVGRSLARTINRQSEGWNSLNTSSGRVAQRQVPPQPFNTTGPKGTHTNRPSRHEDWSPNGARGPHTRRPTR